MPLIYISYNLTFSDAKVEKSASHNSMAGSDEGSQKWKNNHRIKSVKKGVPDIVTTDPKGHIYHLTPKGN